MASLMFAATGLRRASALASSTLRVRAASLSHVRVGRLAAAAAPLQRPGMQHARHLFVKIETTPNPDSLKFKPEDREVLPEQFGTGMHFADAADAQGSRLVRALLKHKEVTGVFLGRDFITVNKKEDTHWTALKPLVLNLIMDAYAELDAKGTPLVEQPKRSEDTVIQPEDDEVVAMIKELIETRIRPAVQEDGGDIFYEGFDADSGTVRVRMAGSCVGCPSSTATLRNGVENMLCHYIPEVKKIEQVSSQAEDEGAKELRSMEERLKAAGADV